MNCCGSVAVATSGDTTTTVEGETETPKQELAKLGYEYNADGVLVQVGTDKGFEFKDQTHYDALADAVLRHVGTLLVDEAGLEPISLPLSQEDGARSVIFATPGYEEAEKLLLIIQGSGRVRVGVWGCALCINKNLDFGTMLPYLRKAHEQGYKVIVLNPNENFVGSTPIVGSESPEAHVEYVIRELLAPRCRAAKDGGIVDVVAHSNGGRALLDFLGKPANWSAEALKIRRVVLTDSYHGPDQVEVLPSQAKDMLADPSRVVNFVPHEAPIGTAVTEWITLRFMMRQQEKGCACVSAQAPDHASTNHCSLDAAFDFFAA